MFKRLVGIQSLRASGKMGEMMVFWINDRDQLYIPDMILG